MPTNVCVLYRLYGDLECGGVKLSILPVKRRWCESCVIVCSGTFVPWLQLSVNIWAERTYALSIALGGVKNTQSDVRSDGFWAYQPLSQMAFVSEGKTFKKLCDSSASPHTKCPVNCWSTYSTRLFCLVVLKCKRSSSENRITKQRLPSTF